jgi:predicted HicB family RNase H-like nuclease
MQLSQHIEALLADLAAAGSLGDEAVAEAAERLSSTLRASAYLRLLDLLSDATLEINGQLRAGQIEIRLAGQEPTFVYVESADTPDSPAGDDSLTARITLRLPDSLKEAIDAAAAREGVSANAWLVRELKRAVHRAASSRGHGFGSRLTGFADN